MADRLAHARPQHCKAAYLLTDTARGYESGMDLRRSTAMLLRNPSHSRMSGALRAQYPRRGRRLPPVRQLSVGYDVSHGSGPNKVGPRGAGA